MFRGRDEKGNVYAIKVLRDRDGLGNQIISNVKVIQAFKKEMSKYLQVDLPGVVKVYEVHIPQESKLPYKSIDEYLEDPPYIVMEYMEGGSLRNLISSVYDIDLEQFLEIAIQILSIVKELHKLNIIHLDLKPENILFKDRFRRIVKIGDLGASKIVVNGKTHISQFSIRYAAPEVFHGYATFKSDVYSLGCIFYELLTKVNPQNYRLSIAGTLTRSSIPPIRYFRSDIPEEIDNAILRMLSFDESDRPTIDEVLAIFNKYYVRVKSTQR